MLVLAGPGGRQRVVVAKAAGCLLLPLLVGVMTPGQIRGQTSPREITLRRSVPRDAETMVSADARWRAVTTGSSICSTRSIPVLELVTPPAHGTVQFVTTDIGVPRGSGCTNSVYGQAVLYHPAPGFVGEDQFTYNSPADPTSFNHLGPPPGLRTVIVTVRDQNALAR